jgi:flagellar hook-associated protein 2
MTSQTTGKGSDITVASGTLGLGTFTRVGELAQNAEYTIDGIAMESTSNKVTSAISGVNLELIAKGDSSIKVASNTDTLKTSVQSFVTAYNALIGSINSQTKVTATGETATTTAGALTGDATMRQLVSTLRGELLNGSGSGALASLSQIGLNTDQKTGLLSLDNKKWDKAVATGGADVAGLFTGDKGLITRMTKATDSYVGTTGVLASRTSSLDAKLTDLDTEQKALDRRIESLQLSLSAKYNAMDSLVAKLRASSSSIMTTLNSLNNPKTT